MLLDSNIIIYASLSEFPQLRTFIVENPAYVSAISYVEVLGYHKLSSAENVHFTTFFDVTPILPISAPILGQAVKLRQLKKISLGDSIIGATALVHGLTLVTRNAKDFSWIPNLQVLDPLA